MYLTYLVGFSLYCKHSSNLYVQCYADGETEATNEE